MPNAEMKGRKGEPRKNTAESSGESAGGGQAGAEEDDGPASEDYTCVISRGPNPRTVHIFGDRVVEGARVAESPPPAPARQGRGFLSL